MFLLRWDFIMKNLSYVIILEIVRKSNYINTIIIEKLKIKLMQCYYANINHRKLCKLV